MKLPIFLGQKGLDTDTANSAGLMARTDLCSDPLHVSGDSVPPSALPASWLASAVLHCDWWYCFGLRRIYPHTWGNEKCFISVVFKRLTLRQNGWRWRKFRPTHFGALCVAILSINIPEFRESGALVSISSAQADARRAARSLSLENEEHSPGSVCLLFYHQVLSQKIL